MLHYFSRLAALAVLISGGCSGSPSTSPDKGVDPVSSLRSQVAKGKDRVIRKGWTLTEPVVDVRKTDSLVSPYEGSATFRASGYRISQDSTDTYKMNVKLVFSCQNERWSVKAAQYQNLNFGEGDWRNLAYERNVRPESPTRKLADEFNY